MKNIFTFLFVLLCSFTKAQTMVDTSYSSTYYEQKVTLHRLLPIPKSAIIFLGNSLTDIGEWAEIFNNKKVINRGISGDNTFGVLARLTDIVKAKPAKIFIMIGINDIARNTPDSIIILNYTTIINTILKGSPTTTLIIQSILPTNNDFKEFARHQNKLKHILFINEALQLFCKKNGIIYVDLFFHFKDNNGKLNKQYTNDGLHINGQGYMLWKQVLVNQKLIKA